MGAGTPFHFVLGVVTHRRNYRLRVTLSAAFARNDPRLTLYWKPRSNPRQTIIPRRKATETYFRGSKMSKLDKEVQKILDAFDAGEYQRAPDFKERRVRPQQYAEGTFKKDARINIRLSSKDVRGLQKKALAEGIPYRTLVASILHKYAEGRLHEDRQR